MTTQFLEKVRRWSADRQYLGRKGEDILTVLRTVCGVYSTHPSGPLSLFARVRDFSSGSFFALEQSRKVVRIPAMRLSVHLVPVEEAPHIMAATVPGAQSGHWEKRYSQKGRHVPPDRYPDWVQGVLHSTTTPKDIREIRSALDIPDKSVKPLLNRMAFERILLRIGAGSLRSNAMKYVSAKDWVYQWGREPEQGTALVWLAHRYLKAFGPARIKDFQWWAGITKTKAQLAFESLEAREIETGIYLLDEDLPAFEAYVPRNTGHIDILPQWDCYTMGYAPDGRSRFADVESLKTIYGKRGATLGNALGTILIDGLARGVWKSRFEGEQMEVRITWFGAPRKTQKEKVDHSFSPIAALLGAKRFKLVFADTL